MVSLPERIVAGIPPFIFVGDHPAIDFANTLSLANGQRIEHLPTWTDLIDWLSETGLSTEPPLQLPASRRADALKTVWDLRQAWQSELARLVSGQTLSDEFLGRLNSLLTNDVYHQELRREEETGLRLVRSMSQLHGEKLALALLGRQIASFLAEANLNYLHRCANTVSCVLYFYDTTKNHRRQWCSVAGCGNRHKVAQFRERRKFS